MPAAYLLVTALQQFWPFNCYPDSIGDSLYVAHAELAWRPWPLLLVADPRHSSQSAPAATRGRFVGWASHGALLPSHATLGYLWSYTRSQHSEVGGATRQDRAIRSEDRNAWRGCGELRDPWSGPKFVDETMPLVADSSAFSRERHRRHCCRCSQV